MKKTWLFILLSASFISCTKDDDGAVFRRIQGQWEWVESSGGIAGTTLTPESTGKQVTIEFSNGTYRRVVNGDLEMVMAYHIEKGQSIMGEEDAYLLIYENEYKQSIYFNDNRLVLSDECYDCFQNEYVRK
jgi:hypothetical protein